VENIVQGSEGTGLGLAISHNYIEIMGGELTVNSTVNQGSRFTIRLPTTSVDNNDINHHKKNERNVISIVQGQAEIRILIVEDSTQNRLLLGAILRRVGLKYREAVNGQEAIEVFKQWQPDLIWMDMRMPVKDGYQATAEIRRLPRGDQVKIIALTASAFKEEQPQIIDAGCDDLLLKPYKPQQIYSMLSQQLGMKFNCEVLNLTVEALSVLSPNALKLLHEKVLNLEPDEINQVIEEISLEHGAVAESLFSLVDNLDFELLLKMLEQLNIERSDGVNDDS
jgi:CheY-like chemotaxis protein